MSTVKRVAVIGAGASGLTAIKCCIDEDLEPVKLISKDEDFKNSGKWNLTVLDKETNETDHLVFDAVMVCTGHHAEKNIPIFKGLSDFQGKVLHTHDFKTPASFEGKRVVVIGIGNSGGDVSVELSRVASQVYLSTRRGSWIINRIVENGAPIDMVRSSRFIFFLRDLLPRSRIEQMAQKQLNNRFDHAAYCLQPKHGVTAAHPTVNDALPNQIASGSIIVKPDIKQFTTSGVEFTDGTYIDDIDVVILGTGYIFGFPFIDKSVIDVKQNKVDMYMLMFPPNIERHTLAIIGCFQPLGAIMPLSEMQSRLSTRVFKGYVTLPSRDEMWAEINKRRSEMAQRYVESQRHTIQVDYVTYMIELGEMIGCNPSFKQMMLKDPKLLFKCIFGPCTPYQFRLTGPGKWDGARQAIMTQWERTFYPLKTRPLGFKVETSSKRFYLYVFFAVIIALLVKLFFSM